MALSVPLSRFTSRVGGGSAFFVRHRGVTCDMKAKRIKDRLVFLVVGLLFVCFAIMAVGSRGFKTGVHGTTSGYVSATEQPIEFWTVVVVTAVLGLVALFYVFKRDKHDA